MINDASVVIGGGNWGIKEADVLGYKLINNEYYAREIDFANSTAAGTYTDSTGVVRKSPYNLLQYSEQFDNATWTKQAGTVVTANAAISPDGYQNADLVVGTGNGIFQSGKTVPTTTPNTKSVYLKGVSGGEVVILQDPFQTVGNTVCTLTTNWQRFTLTETQSGGLGGLWIAAIPAGGIYVWGAQLVEGTEALPYFPTTTRLNVPRIDYRNADGSLSTTGRLLLEPQRTNGIIYSEAFTYWYAPADGVTLTPNTTDTVSPDGTNNASKIQIVGGNKRSYEITLSSAGAGTFSLFVKAGTSTNIAFFTSSASLLVSFNLTTQVITATTGTGTITSYGNGWLRITASGTLVAGEVIQLLYSGSAGQTIYIWGAQVEAGAYATSYIPTLGASVTRGADACSKTGISSLIGQTEGTLFADFVVNGMSQNVNILNSEKNTTASFFLGLQTNGKIDAGLFSSGSVVARITEGSLSVGQRAKVAYAYKSGSSALYINGTQVGTSSNTFTLPSTLDDLFLNDTTTYFNYQENVSFNQSALFPTRLTNSQLQSLTTL